MASKDAPGCDTGRMEMRGNGAEPGIPRPARRGNPAGNESGRRNEAASALFAYMTTLYTHDPEAIRLARLCFPDYNGTKFTVSPFPGEMRLDSYWDGGSRSYYAILDLNTNKTAEIPENGTIYANGGKVIQSSFLPLNFLIAEHHISRGKDLGVRLYVHPENLTKYLPAPTLLSNNETIVLAFTRERKSSYNGQNRAQMACSEAGMPLDVWEMTKQSLVARGFLNKAGAITSEGRNAIGDKRTWGLKHDDSHNLP
jgi:hypothetical protein